MERTARSLIRMPAPFTPFAEENLMTSKHRVHRRTVLQGTAFGLLATLGDAVSPSQAASDPKLAAKPANSPAPAAGATQTLDADLAATERVLGLSFTPAERAQVGRGYQEVPETLARIRELDLPNDLSPALRFDPRLPGKSYSMPAAGVRGEAAEAGPLPTDTADLALAPAWKQAAWLRAKSISSVELTRLYLERIARIGPKLQNFVTVTEDLARKQAARADAELAQGRVRSPLHGVPYGLKDLFDVAGVPTTWGAEPYKDRIGSANATVVEKLEAAGCVLLGKTAVGALAYGDVWHDGISRNPWNPEEGSSGSSAGSASATAAGLVGFSIGTETLGSIVSPSHRCGTVGLRPTFGRVSRHGGMALCWSWDKVGPIARSVTDCGLALSIVNGGDPRDWGSIDAPFGFDLQARAQQLRVGYVPAWFEDQGATEVDRRALQALRAAGATLVEIKVPDLPYALLRQLVTVEAAAAFSELTFSGRDEMLKRQDDDAWPNTFRQAHLFPAVEIVQLERLRRQTMIAFDQVLSGVDAMIGPSYAGGALVATNATGHPSLALKAGFIQAPTRQIAGHPTDAKGPLHRVPQTISLWANLFREDVLVTLGRALEARLGVADDHPSIART